jgi:hypothetical protein
MCHPNDSLRELNSTARGQPTRLNLTGGIARYMLDLLRLARRQLPCLSSKIHSTRYAMRWQSTLDIVRHSKAAAAGLRLNWHLFNQCLKAC